MLLSYFKPSQYGFSIIPNKSPSHFLQHLVWSKVYIQRIEVI